MGNAAVLGTDTTFTPGFVKIGYDYPIKFPMLPQYQLQNGNHASPNLGLLLYRLQVLMAR